MLALLGTGPLYLTFERVLLREKMLARAEH
jgi:hypothetical protein